MSKTLLLEIGTEEIPAYAMPGIIAQLKENAEKTFEDLRLSFDSVKTMGTPPGWRFWCMVWLKIRRICPRKIVARQ